MIRLKPRRITNKIMNRLIKGNDLIVLLGARQVGKTSIMHLLMNRGSSKEKKLKEIESFILIWKI